ncbi:hypothetical protein EV421DRAFT_1985383 [Armillaria borealis]|uniref:BRCT domain-containing protein n=1 Tax=Armillaria borealis TaxID=47425 RepID=A0AA39K2J5_9AGAR|nr:hypothetical protein EV421DRAFT_1985383 [Armillaria borealis]
MEGNSNHIVETNAAYNILDDCQDINMPPNHGDAHASGKDTTSDSSRTSVYPTPTYHFHGLGNTQTQSESQVNNDFYDFNDGSQKENMSAPEATVEPKIVFIQASSPVPTTVNGIETRGTKGSYVGSPLEMTKTKGVTFKSPRAATVSSHATPNRRSLAPTCAYNILALLQLRLLVYHAKPFRKSLPFIPGLNRNPKYPPLQHRGRQRGMFSIRPAVYATSSSERVAKSQNSQDSSQRSDNSSDEFLVGAQPRPEEEDEDMYEDVNEEPFSTRNLNADMDIDLPPVADSLHTSPSPYGASADWDTQLDEQTQPATKIATQPSTQVDDSLALGTAATGGSSVVTDPQLYAKIRLVIQSVGREKCRRYLGHIPGLDLVHFDPDDYKSSIPPSTFNPVMSSDVDSMDDIVETQPSNEDEEEIRRRAATLANPQGNSFQAGTVDDSMDIVPDSEPQGEFHPSPKVPTPAFRTKGTAKDDFSEVVPDSLAVDLTEEPLVETRIDLRREEEEEEDASDDLPLALKAVIKDKGKGRADVTPAPKRSLSNNTHETLTPPATVTPAARARGKFKIGSHSSFKDGEVPSSIPEEMAVSTEPHTLRNKGKGKGKPRDYSELSGDEMDIDETKPKVERDDSALPGTSNRKRKRGDTDLSRAVSQSSRAGDSSRSKRSRSVVSTATHSRFNPGDRVFAFHENLFYPATFEEEVGDDLWVRYDGETRSIRSKDARSFAELRPGDYVSIVDPSIDNVLIGGSVRTILEDREGIEFVDNHGEVREVAMSMLRLSPTVLKNSWNERADQSKRDSFSSRIKNAGGKVIADWTNALELDGTHTTTNKWDQHSEKPKYLIALALGVPCIRLRWIEGVARGQLRCWIGMINLEWGTDQGVKMEDIMHNPVAMKVLRGKKVICYSEEFFPPKQTRSDREKERKAPTLCPLIMLAMGAERVEAHRKTSRCQLSNDTLRLADYVVYKDQKPTDPNLKGLTNLVDWQWVKQCLIRGQDFGAGCLKGLAALESTYLAIPLMESFVSTT